MRGSKRVLQTVHFLFFFALKIVEKQGRNEVFFVGTNIGQKSGQSVASGRPVGQNVLFLWVQKPSRKFHILKNGQKCGQVATQRPKIFSVLATKKPRKNKGFSALRAKRPVIF